MDRALAEARAAAERGEVPVGAVVLSSDGVILGAAGNRTRELSDVTAHAEMLAIRQAAAHLRDERLTGCDLIVTLEPCAMCAAAIAAARIRRVVYGAYDPKSGAVDHGPRLFRWASLHHAPEVIGGFRETDCAPLLTQFFQTLRTAQ